ncbi:MAG: hypothetical protein NTV05_00070 [Acidobacteria bacterium]|nr:hypothetical protein [Acidobacteriota bacterium]
MNALALHQLARWRSLAGELRAGGRQWSAVVATALSVPVMMLVGYWAIGDWLTFSTAIVNRAGLDIMHVTSRLLVGILFLTTLPMLVAAAYRAIYPEDELALLRSLPISRIQLFALRFVPCWRMMALALLPAFVMAGATYVRVGSAHTVAWLVVGWLLLSIFGAAIVFTLAVGCGGLRSARVGRVLGDVLLTVGVVAMVALFVWIRHFVKTETLMGSLADLTPGLRVIPQALSMFVVPEGGHQSVRLMAGLGLGLLMLCIAAGGDDLALRRGWGSPWTFRRTASRRPVRRARFDWLPPQWRALVVKDLPEIRRSALALAILFLFTLMGYLGLIHMTGRTGGAAAPVLWKALLWTALPHLFFLWIVPAATMLDVSPEERQSLQLLRSLPINLSRVLWEKFWVSWIPMLVCGLLLSLGLAWTGATRVWLAVVLAAAFVPTSAACTMWALLVGRLTAPTRGSETSVAPFLFHSVALWLPVYAIGSFASGRAGARTPAAVGLAAAFVFVLWLLPLPLLWRRVLRRWGRE